jgi:hypothetical protein
MIWTAVAAAIILGLALLFIHDKRQTSDPVLRRFPVLGWGRKILTSLGPFLRQYWFSNDREETPYNRITRDWI